MGNKLSRWKQWLVGGASLVVTGFAVNEATGTNVAWQRAIWIVPALVGAVTTVANAAALARLRRTASTLAALRESALNRSLDELSTAHDVLTERIDSLIPLGISHDGSSTQSTVAEFAVASAASAPNGGSSRVRPGPASRPCCTASPSQSTRVTRTGSPWLSPSPPTTGPAPA